MGTLTTDLPAPEVVATTTDLRTSTVREVFVSGLREFLGADAGKLAVTKLAKWKTTAQMVAISFMFLGTGLDFYESGHPPLVGETRLPWSDDWSDLATQVGMILIWAAAILTAITGWDYFDKARPWLRDR